MKIQPLADRVVVKLLSAEQKLKSGIIIPDTAKEKPQEGEVVAVGPGRLDKDGVKRIAIELKVGDKVLFENWGGKDYKADGVEYKILREDEILGTIK
ncbi:MAG TPA: co-chaperone GroES [Candidatus Saccharimonadales bacterium]|nr:co-chaperone GroES [Candidatus Saccharimonadales bacterium]